MNLPLNIAVSKKTAKWISECAIERVINSTLDILEHSKHRDSGVNESDWKDSKAVVVKLWVRLQDAIFREMNNLPPQEPDQYEV